MNNKCICIKSYSYRPNNWTSDATIFQKGKTYKYTDQKFVSIKYPEGYNVNFFNREYIYFRKYPDNPLAKEGYESYEIFSTYFKTIKEIRKEKLEKLKNYKII
jgi:hypothetical protein